MSSNLTISFELIYLMGWLLNNEQAKLKKLVKSAIDNGLAQELDHMEPSNQNKMVDQLHSTILDFLMFLEDALLENLDEADVDNSSQESLEPALKKMDLANIDIKTIWTSLQQVKAELTSQKVDALTQESDEGDAQEPDPKEMLFENLLKNWNPENKEPVN